MLRGYMRVYRYYPQIMGCRFVIEGEYRSYIGIMEKKMETTGL